MEELKGIVMKTLETQGILGEIRAKLRTNVFKVLVLIKKQWSIKTYSGLDN